MFASLN
ncbi:hypothetical protein D018_0136A, partial [Vibrio parahaemolyticus VP2007-007]